MLPETALNPAVSPPTKPVRNIADEGAIPPRILPVSAATETSPPVSTQYALSVQHKNTAKNEIQKEMNFPVLKNQVMANAITAITHQGKNNCKSKVDNPTDKKSFPAFIS
jgi:hypothetical protein